MPGQRSRLKESEVMVQKSEDKVQTPESRCQAKGQGLNPEGRGQPRSQGYKTKGQGSKFRTQVQTLEVRGQAKGQGSNTRGQRPGHRPQRYQATKVKSCKGSEP